ncbi:MAG: zinc ABC transporter substrate-binding protein [Bacteroidota bacterium]
MIRILIICLLGVPILGFGQEDQLKVVATTTFLADMAAEIAGPHAEVVSLLPSGADPHIYDPIPEDAKLIADADLVLKNGLTLEGWLDEMIAYSGTMAEVVTLTEGIKAIESADHPGAMDPHAWMNPKKGLKYLENIKNALIALDPGNRKTYQTRFQAYFQAIDSLDKVIEERLKPIPENHRILATTHDAFRYFGERYGLEVLSVIGTSTDAEPTISDVREMIDQVEAAQVPAIFMESTIRPKTLNQIALDRGVKIGGKLYADALGPAGSGADTYFKMLDQNSRIIKSGLTDQGVAAEQESWLALILVVTSIFALSFILLIYRLRQSSREDLDWQTASIEVRELSVSYDRKTALSSIFLSLQSGKIYGLIGGNGSGKSTLLKSILGLLTPDSGTITINHQSVEEVRKYISYIPQKEEIDWDFPASVFDVVLMGRYPHKKVFERLTDQDRALAEEALGKLGILHLRDKQIGELSGGQQQRTFIARALCQQAEIYIMDEPFVGVDITTEGKIMDIVRNLAREGKLVLIVHHDLAKVKDYFDELIMLNQRLIAIGPTEKVFTDDNIRDTYGGRLTILQKTEAYKNL